VYSGPVHIIEPDPKAEASHPIISNYSKNGNNAVLSESLQFVILELQQL
jgi:hypothetical protein